LPDTEDVLTTSAGRRSRPRSAGAGAFPVEEHDGPEVEVELHVDALGLDVGDRAAEPHAGVVDEDVEAPEALAVTRDDVADRRLVGHVRRHGLDLVALGPELVGGAVELVRAPGGDGERVALLAQHAGEAPARSRSKLRSRWRHVQAW
jgi:hypothetical protein